MNMDLENKVKILVVDDEAGIAKMLQGYLIKRGFDAITASGGHEALKTIKSGLKINLMLLDMKMPGSDGFYVLKEMRSMDIKIPVIILTGILDAEKYKDALKQVGFAPEDIVNKPVDLFMLLKAVVQKLKMVEQSKDVKT